ncbi:hypothetical protein GCM10022631_01610 [Deinococcus rubellus]|uniref:DUF1515 domain-containing protein n=1 Tax=Deinococcus rubellus TaxID=1889240 RepID=A0ABY5YJ80_9DEIO|nr:hypothetical protein [Deinococcus rubellus]UWX64741.1 hypothetical protein N0D28_03520 [Deinococcus rubellus]
MSDQVDLQQLNATLQTLQKALERLERSVSGDRDNNVPSIREFVRDAVAELRLDINKIKSDLNSVDTAASDRLDAIEQLSRVQAARQEGQMTVIKYLGGGSLVSLVGLIVTVFKLTGSHP